MSLPVYHLCMAGEWVDGQETYDIANPYTAQPIATIHRASAADLERAIEASVAAVSSMRALAAHQRATILRTVSQSLREQAEAFARTISQEAAKPIKQARAEVERSIFTFAQAAEEATRIPGEVLTLDAAPAGEGRQGIVRRFPIGPVAAITPFNFPLNLVAHKLAPAIAAGCPVILKPASQTPMSALKLAELIIAAGLPAGGLSVLPMKSSDAAPLIEDERLKAITFTGSPAVGWGIKNRAGRKRVMLELGGNAGVIVHNDADLSHTVNRIVAGGFQFAGQSCISVQRVFVHEDIYKKVMSLLVPAVQALQVGDPADDATDLSSLIAPDEAKRVQEWLDEARAAGATIVTGGTVEGGVVMPTVLTDVDVSLRVSCQEIFAPVINIQPYHDFADAIQEVNHSEFGLQAGVFTQDITRIWQAYEQLDVGGVIVNDVPTWRIDHMPYGGVKQSGFGREGLRYAIEELTEPKLLVLNLG